MSFFIITFVQDNYLFIHDTYNIMAGLADDFRGDLKFMRQQKGITHAEMADKLCISESAYGKLERGQTSWTLDKVDAAVKIVFDKKAKIILI